MIFDTKYCTGCKTCEIACSFHHRSVFRPGISSIKIISTPKQLGFKISIYGQSEGNHFACNGCEGLDEPFCLRYCNPVARHELKEIMSRFGRMKKA